MIGMALIRAFTVDLLLQSLTHHGVVMCERLRLNHFEQDLNCFELSCKIPRKGKIIIVIMSTPFETY